MRFVNNNRYSKKNILFDSLENNCICIIINKHILFLEVVMKPVGLKPNDSIVTGHAIRPPRKSVAPKAIAPKSEDGAGVSTPVHTETAMNMGANASVMGYVGAFWCTCKRSVDVIEPEKTTPKPATSV